MTRRQYKPIRVRNVFRGYAVIFGFLGLILFLWGPMWFGVHLAGVPFGRAALVRVFGSMWMIAAFSAAALATVDDAQAQHRGLFWFAIGHAVVWLAWISTKPIPPKI